MQDKDIFETDDDFSPDEEFEDGKELTPLSNYAPLTIVEYVNSPFWFDNNSEKSFELFRKALVEVLNLSKFDELLKAYKNAQYYIDSIEYNFDPLEDFCHFDVDENLFNSKQLTNKIKSVHNTLVCSIKLEILKETLSYMYNQKTPKEKEKYKDEIENLISFDSDEPDSTDALDLLLRQQELQKEDELNNATTLLAFIENKNALTTLDPAFMAKFNNLLAQTLDPDELLSALEIIEDQISEIAYWSGWHKEHHETKKKATIMKRGLILERLKNVLNTAHDNK